MQDLMDIQLFCPYTESECSPAYCDWFPPRPSMNSFCATAEALLQRDNYLRDVEFEKEYCGRCGRVIAEERNKRHRLCWNCGETIQELLRRSWFHREPTHYTSKP